jgi:hypothetical protein
MLPLKTSVYPVFVYVPLENKVLETGTFFIQILNELTIDGLPICVTENAIWLMALDVKLPSPISEFV